MQPLVFTGLSFLTPLDALFGFAVVVPLGALLLSARAAARVRRVLALPQPRRRRIVPATAALVLLVALVAAAAAQPVVVRRQLVSERADAQAYFIFDTSLSMKASTGPLQPTRLTRAKRLARRLRAQLPDLPVGIASMTDRTLPNLMPTTDAALFGRTLTQSVRIDSPPPSQVYHGRATTFAALAPLVDSHFFSAGVVRPVLVVFTDGESQPLSSVLKLSLKRRVTPIYVHVWSPRDRIYDRAHGRKPDPGYTPDPGSALALDELTQITGGSAYAETQLSRIEQATREAAGFAPAQRRVSSYARVALAPWFVLGGILPLGFLLYRRNL